MSRQNTAPPSRSLGSPYSYHYTRYEFKAPTLELKAGWLKALARASSVSASAVAPRCVLSGTLFKLVHAQVFQTNIALTSHSPPFFFNFPSSSSTSFSPGKRPQNLKQTKRARTQRFKKTTTQSGGAKTAPKWDKRFFRLRNDETAQNLQ